MQLQIQGQYQQTNKTNFKTNLEVRQELEARFQILLKARDNKKG